MLWREGGGKRKCLALSGLVVALRTRRRSGGKRLFLREKIWGFSTCSIGGVPGWRFMGHYFFCREEDGRSGTEGGSLNWGGIIKLGFLEG